jgi:hypothetical protein
MLVSLIRVKQKKDDDERFLGLEFSMPLTPEHKGQLPKKIERQWENLEEGDVKTVQVFGIAPQSITLRLEPAQKESAFSVSAMWIETAELALIEETGAGASKEVVRLRFTAWMNLQMDELKWASKHYDNEFWMELSEAQGELYPE